MEKNNARQVIVVLSNASLETVKVGSGKGKTKVEHESSYQLLNCDDHHNLLKKAGKDIADYRPDIAHQCLLTLLDSPLNKSGHLKVYIQTQKKVLIEVNPQIRIPRTFKRFAGLIVQLLHKLSIRSVSSTEKLLKVIKNPIDDHLPAGCFKIVLSGDAPVVKLNKWTESLKKDIPICFFIGAFAHGKDDLVDSFEDKIGISKYPLSASVACAKICGAFEELWDII
jgi:rRNA small subunit pseudouridine methyltransferase Nep1